MTIVVVVIAAAISINLGGANPHSLHLYGRRILVMGPLGVAAKQMCAAAGAAKRGKYRSLVYIYPPHWVTDRVDGTGQRGACE